MSAAETVRAFIESWAKPHNLKAAMRQFMTPDCVYENVGLSKTTGPDDAIAFFDAFAAQLPFASIEVETLGLLAQGNKVMTERVDHILDAAGKRLASIRVMGAFELRGGKIAAWRDYFDTVPFASKPE